MDASCAIVLTDVPPLIVPTFQVICGMEVLSVFRGICGAEGLVPALPASSFAGPPALIRAAATESASFSLPMSSARHPIAFGVPKSLKE